jgi:CDP-4-dehydro-6-deoxyglucose reductase
VTTFMVRLKDDKFFPVEEGMTLLEGAQRSKIMLPYSCREGRCNSCKCKVVRGETIALRDESGLTFDQRNMGWILSCVRTPKSDILLEIEDLNALNLPEVRTLPAKIQSMRRLAKDVMGVHLRLPPNSNFMYCVGQYIDVFGSDGVKRSYSIANAPASDHLLELQVKRVDDGRMSNYWFERAKVNDLLRIKGPLGTFCLRNADVKHLIFLATGTGIAPIKAMIESFTMEGAINLPDKISLYWGVRQSSDLYWDPSDLNLILNYRPVLSREKKCSFQTGYVQDVLLREVEQFSGAVVYACGSPEMIADAYEKLIRSGCLESQFYSDAFVASGMS